MDNVNQENQLKPQKTSFSNISKVSTGSFHSLFQNNEGEIFSCGYNRYGQCGLGHFDTPQITPSLILNLPSNIVHFVCGGLPKLGNIANSFLWELKLIESLLCQVVRDSYSQ